MKACMEAASDANARTLCRTTTAKDALATALGKQASDVTATELNTFVRESAKARVSCNCAHVVFVTACGNQVTEEMTACMEAATDGAARTTCKDTTTKQAIATALGKQTSDITATDLNKFVDGASKEQVFVLQKYAAY